MLYTFNCGEFGAALLIVLFILLIIIGCSCFGGGFGSYS
ncbi:sporulation protein YjcZ [Priestia aryabhattai]